VGKGALCAVPTIGGAGLGLVGTLRFAHPTDYLFRHCEEPLRRSNPSIRAKKRGLLRFARNDG
jgi:hypothetical protein